MEETEKTNENNYIFCPLDCRKDLALPKSIIQYSNAGFTLAK